MYEGAKPDNLNPPKLAPVWDGGVQPAQESLFLDGNVTLKAHYYWADDMAGVHSGLCLSLC